MDRTAERDSLLAEEHVHRKRPKQKRWISEDTVEMIEQKRVAFLRQED